MQKREISEHALVGKTIRNHLKKLGYSGVVRVDSKGGTSVDIYLTDLSPRQIQEVTLYCNQFKAGHFNSMTDMYEFNHAKSGPTVQYISVNNQFSDEKRQHAFDVLRSSIYAEEMASLKPVLKENNPYTMIDSDPLSKVIFGALEGHFEDEAIAVWGEDHVKRDIDFYMINDNSEIEVLDDSSFETLCNPIASLGFLEVSQRAC